MTPEEKRIVDQLLKQNLINNQQLAQTIQKHQQLLQQGHKVPILSWLVQSGYITSQQMTNAFQQITSKPLHNNFLNYHIKEKLGQGGMGAVYKALDTKLNRIVALKVISANENVSKKQIQRFMLEAKSMATLNHPNIVDVYEVGEHPQNYFTMEYISGGTLAKTIKEDKITPKQAAQIIAKCAQAVLEVHKNNIVHRDIKPLNIMLDKQNEPRLMDFGLVKVIDTDLSNTGEVLGTPRYMSPEQIQGKTTDNKSDIYSLGATLYEALTQRSPFQGLSFVNIACQIIENDPISLRSLNPDIPIELEAICLKCLHKNPQKRYPNAHSLAKDLENFLTNKPIIARPATKIDTVKKWIVRNRSFSIISIISLLVVIVSVSLVIISLSNQAKIQRQAALDSKKAQNIALRERDRAIAAEKKALEAQQQIKQERDRAIKAVKLAQTANYYTAITLAQKYCEDGNTAEVERELSRTPKSMRNWEWHWLKYFAHDEYMSFVGESGFRSCDLSFDNKKIVAVDKNSQISIWDIPSKQKQIFPEKDNGTIHCVFSPDGQIIATAHREGVTLWSIAGKKLKKFKNNNASYCQFSPDGKILAVAYYIYKVYKPPLPNLILWNVQTGEQIFSAIAHGADQIKNDILCCNFNYNGKKLVTSGQDFLVNIWDIKTGTIQKKLRGHRQKVSICRFSPNGKYIVSGADDNEVILWDAKTGRILRRLKGHKAEIRDCRFGPKKTIVSCSNDNRLIIWDIKKGTPRHIFQGHTDIITNGLISSNKKFIVSSSFDRTLKFWKLSKKPKPITFKYQFPILDIAISPNKKTIAVALPYTIQLRNAKTLKLLSSFNVLGALLSCAFSPNSESLLVATTKKIQQFNCKNNQHQIDFTVYDQNLSCSALSFDGKLVIAGSKRNRLYIWETNSFNKKSNVRRPIVQLAGKQSGKIWDCAFSVDNKKIAFVSSSELMVWNTKTKKLLRKFHHNYSFRTCKFSSNGQYLLVATEFGQILLFDNKQYRIVKIFKGHSGGINCAIFSDDNRRIFSAGADKTIKIWDTTATGTLQNGIENIEVPLLTLKEHLQEVSTLLINPEDKSLLSSEDKMLKIWKIK